MADLKARSAALMDTPQEAEAQFYESMRDADLERMMAIWSDDEDIVCVHPGGGRLVGPRAVRAAFEAIFSTGNIAVEPEHVRRVQTMGTCVSSVLERVDMVTSEGTRRGWIVATNVYVKSAQGWRLVAHHASPGLIDEPADADEAPAVLH